MVRIEYVKQKDIDKVKWDTCIDNAPNALIYGYSYYLDVMSKNWDALIMNDYEAVMPLTWNRKFGISYLRQPAFTQQSGIFGNGPFSNHLTEQFVNKALEIFPFAEINLNFANEYRSCTSLKCNLILDLNRPFTVIEQSFKKDLVKKAKTAQLIYEESGEIEEAAKLFKRFYSQRLPNVTEKDYEDLLHLCAVLKTKGQLLIRKVNSSEGKLLAISIFFKDKRRIYYIMSATLPGGRNHDANHFLLHELIKEFSEQDLIFDFEGSEIPSVRFFFRKFSPVEQPYCFIAINKLNFWKRWIKNTYDYYKYSSSK